jgi:IS30 family transposase
MEVRRRERPLERKLERPELNAAVRAGLVQHWSPDQIAGRLKQEHPEEKRLHVAPQTIYAWIARDRDREHWESFLRRGGKTRKSRQSGRIPRQVRIEGRPEEANQRSRLGDFEGDTIVSRGQRSGIVTLVDRKSRYLLAAKLKDRTARRTRKKIEHLLGPLPADHRQTATFDNGKEFAEHEALAQRLEMEVFFADPYCSWQRGTNENTNRLLRQYYPKGTDFADISHHDLAHTVQAINQRPRKVLNYQTPSEVFLGSNAPKDCI